MLELGAWYWTHFVLKSSETHIFQIWLAGVTGHCHHTRHWRRGWAGQRPGDPGGGAPGQGHHCHLSQGSPLVCVTVQGVASVCCVQCAEQTSEPQTLTHWLRGLSLCWASLTATGSHHSPLLRPGWAPLSNVSLCCLSSECRLLGCQARLSPVLAEAGGL